MSKIRTILLLVLIAVLALSLSSCKKETPSTDNGQTNNAAKCCEKAGTPECCSAEKAPAKCCDKAGTPECCSAKKVDADMIPLPIELPPAVFVGTPTNLKVKNLEKPTGEPRPVFYVPAGTTNVALNKPITSTDDMPIIGEIAQINDGDAQATDGSWVELGPLDQHITVDLGAQHEIYAVLFWHFHKQGRVYFDVVVQTADDADFITNVQTIFNNDDDNSLGLGAGKDMNYVETNEGKLVDAKGVKGRYVRFYSNGNNANDMNHYVEVAVFGKPAK